MIKTIFVDTALTIVLWCIFMAFLSAGIMYFDGVNTVKTTWQVTLLAIFFLWASYYIVISFTTKNRGNKKQLIEPYRHDCGNCVWVGWTKCDDAKSGWGNMYFCKPMKRYVADSKGLGQGSIIIRYGNGLEEYLSMPVGALTKGSLEVR